MQISHHLNRYLTLTTFFVVFFCILTDTVTAHPAEAANVGLVKRVVPTPGNAEELSRYNEHLKTVTVVYSGKAKNPKKFAISMGTLDARDMSRYSGKDFQTFWSLFDRHPYPNQNFGEAAMGAQFEKEIKVITPNGEFIQSHPAYDAIVARILQNPFENEAFGYAGESAEYHTRLLARPDWGEDSKDGFKVLLLHSGDLGFKEETDARLAKEKYLRELGSDTEPDDDDADSDAEARSDDESESEDEDKGDVADFDAH